MNFVRLVHRIQGIFCSQAPARERTLAHLRELFAKQKTYHTIDRQTYFTAFTPWKFDNLSRTPGMILAAFLE